MVEDAQSTIRAVLGTRRGLTATSRTGDRFATVVVDHVERCIADFVVHRLTDQSTVCSFDVFDRDRDRKRDVSRIGEGPRLQDARGYAGAFQL